MYGLSDEDLEIQARAATLADELIPSEVEAELNDGELPKEVTAAHAARARELGLCATNMPTELGGMGYTTLQQVLVQEQGGRVTNALAWVASTPPSWMPAVATPFQLERFVIPAIRGEREECYAITEEGAGSDVDAIVATARRDGDDYLLNGEKWHVTSYNAADFAFFQGKLVGGEHDGEHAMFLVDLPSPGVRVVRTPAYSHSIGHHHPIVAFERRAGARDAPGRRGGRRHELRLRVVPVRADDGGRALPGRGAAADRGDDQLRGRSGRCRAGRSRCSARSRPCWPTA